jgi:hypothetical protein
LEAPLVRVAFQEINGSGRISLAHLSTRQFLEQNNIELIEVAIIRLCQPTALPSADASIA